MRQRALDARLPPRYNNPAALITGTGSRRGIERRLFSVQPACRKRTGTEWQISKEYMPHINKKMISFFLTTKCNLRCVYCYNSTERAKEERTLSFEFAKAGIDYFFRETDSRHIRFYGPGEPTREFPLMKRIAGYARHIAGGAVSVEIQTNGVFGPEIRTWLSENAHIVWFSFDGPPDIQNSNRPLPGNKPSAEIIEENVKYFTRLAAYRAGGNVAGVRITMSDKNIHRQIEMIDYFRALGVRHIWTDPLFPAVDTRPVCEDPEKERAFRFDMDGYLDEFIPAYQYAKERGVFYSTFLMCNFDGESPYHCRSCIPVPHLTPDGYVSACDLVTFGETAHHMDPFIYGRWNETANELEFFEDKISALRNRRVENMDACKNCSVSPRCGGYCPGEVLNETGSLTGRKPRHCGAIKRLAKTIGFSEERFPVFHP
jgi:uncharacterized protein